MKIFSVAIFVFLQVLQCQFCEAQDWPGFARYRDANEALKSSPAPGDRVVFMGNSITDAWINASPEFFEKNHYVDRGISGQTSPQMLVRFRADVISLKPKAVLLLCGTNDIAGNTGPSTLEMIEDNIMSMAELAKANKIKMILCSVLPAYQYPWKPEIEPVEKITALNQWIKEYAEKNKFAYLDYYSSLVDDRKGMKSIYSKDGVHPNEAGYQVMEKLAEPLIKKLIH
ncbi:MAG: SGNH/GDSL hydrolase family protein [Bacteroidota bacterium]|nr:SGNH/GDSL hydrolase family protein [Bacteroidota bacterium]MDP4248583.1 SGNH/GDSL hydrolase family protein [Bacteroidota bacterium]